ncbi:ATP-binding protein [Pseudobutyrivibrio xylanivorans]|uniref:AAA family ATPase n=1 Tax=Pseudobutyrivibrio xylanivorans TaxID=185007 RepID=A0A5P6VUV9_PSEXY|nr:ATP-binding protein [Pseudobutyrivibrio xylanivorans]QFJ55044.1 AAA family ATPase [Pseudobutyrivibrio xylanivorans]
MALSNEQYDALMRQYNHKQARNNQIVAYRTDEVYSAIPTLSELDAEVSKVSVSSITAIFNGENIESAAAASRRRLSELKDRRIKLMEAAGFPADYLEPPYDCPDCKDTGYINGKRCHCFKQAALNIVYKQSNLNNILSKENFNFFDLNVYDENYFEGNSGVSARATAQIALERAQNFVQNFKAKGGNLLLLGQTGCGKTFLSNCIAKALLDEGISVIYFTASELFKVFEEQTFKKNADMADLHDSIFDCDLLIIDDLGTEFPNNFTITKLFQCLNERLLRSKSTVISTNLSLEEMRDTYSERITSRVFSYYDAIRLIGDDIRIKKVMMNK